MSYGSNPYQSPLETYAAMAATDERSSFIVKTYFHLAGAIAAFIGLEAILLNSPLAETLTETMLGARYGWVVVLGAFMAVSWIANNWATSATSPAMQYMGLGLYVFAEAIIFVPLLFIAQWKDPSIIPTAGLTTLGLFGFLTAVVFFTRHDFSFLRSVLIFGGFAALGLCLVAAIFQFALGPIFTYAMIAFACAYILYDTSNVLHHYRIGQHIAAALALFASVALLFWYIVQLFLSRRD